MPEGRLAIPRFFEPADADWWEQAVRSASPAGLSMQPYQRKLQRAAEAVIHGEASRAVQE